jgi:transcriptional regulator with XRE-family HTH domain
MKRSEPESVPSKDPKKYVARKKEIGRLLRHRRLGQGLNLLQCAEHIGTSRQRYSAIEAGKSPIHLVEFEELIKLLTIKPNEIWPDWGKEVEGEKVTKLHVETGRNLTIVVEALDPLDRYR